MAKTRPKRTRTAKTSSKPKKTKAAGRAGAAKAGRSAPGKPPPKSPPGRKSKLELMPSIEKALAKQLRLGVPIKYACANVGISETAYQNWIQRAETGVSEDTGAALPEEDVERYRAFRDAMTRARGQKVEKLLRRLHKAARTPNALTGQYDTRPATWLLERGEPEAFRPPAQRSELTGKDGGPIAVGSWADLVADTHDEQLREQTQPDPPVLSAPEGEPSA